MWRQVRKCVESLWKFSEAKDFKFSLLWSQSQKTQQTQDGLLTLTEKLCLPNANPTSQRNFLFSHFPLLFNVFTSTRPSKLNNPCVLLGRGSTEHTLHVHPAEESNPQSQSHSWDPRANGVETIFLSTHRKDRRGKRRYPAAVFTERGQQQGRRPRAVWKDRPVWTQHAFPFFLVLRECDRKSRKPQN